MTKAKGIDMVGEDGLLSRLSKATLKKVLEAEMDECPGCAKHERAEQGNGNARNGPRTKTVITESGPVEITVPRDREGSFDSQSVKKRQRRLDGVKGSCCRYRPRD